MVYDCSLHIKIIILCTNIMHVNAFNSILYGIIPAMNLPTRTVLEHYFHEMQYPLQHGGKLFNFYLKKLDTIVHQLKKITSQLSCPEF